MPSSIFLVDSGRLILKAGSFNLQGQTIIIQADVEFTPPPSPIVWMENEPLKLSLEVPQGFNIGTRLSGPDAWDINALGALIPETVTLRTKPEGKVLKEGCDYLLSAPHALLGLGPESGVSTQDIVYATYAYGLLRIDSVVMDEMGVIAYVTGISHITTPLPPRISDHSLRLANIYIPYQAQSVSPEHIFPVVERATEAVTGTTAARIPKTLSKLRSGESVKIVCWGDSVTAGGNASEKRYRYTDVFVSGLRQRFPMAHIAFFNISVGGSSSVNWLYPSEYPFLQTERQKDLNFKRITDIEPDLVTLEFVNDTGLDNDIREKAYEHIRHQLDEIGAELILITPHFTHPSWMGIDLRGSENRFYVQFLKDFAEKYSLALADASARWEHLWKEGVPYLTLLHNSVNHPDNRGHYLFAEELWKCFE